jgi:7,8-dihydropterin-6-yl-methyl-4-(beta-D-ribofuranosyl)aminobenzene 5'-phosphate synthase
MKSKVKISVIYDNNSISQELQADWGFACLIECEETKILFDAGEIGNILLSNIVRLNIDPHSIDILFLSHFHHDHSGGLKEFLKINPNVKVYYPQSFPVQLIEVIKISDATPVPVSDFQEILTDIFTLGEIDGIIPEQSLAIRSSKGIVVITGCAHPGIINILEKTKECFQKELIYLVMGGFHLHKLTDEERTKTINKIFDMGIQSIVPTHCSGDVACKMFSEKYGANYLEIGVGKILEID